MRIEEDLWRGRRVLITGHTGFKGAWLSLWLQLLGAEVTGIARGAPSEPSLYAVARVGEGIAAERALDVRDRDGLIAALAATKPEVVLHLAAQPLVRRSYADPAETYEVNVLGTVNLLEAVRLAGDCVKALLVVTSDKCYEPGPAGARSFFKEGDPLGGEDPYSSSKACAEIVSAAYSRSFFAADDGPRVATARAGNVIGGGDWGRDRLLPDAVKVATGLQRPPLLVRNPDAVRPWQHVLNPLAGYLLLAQRLLADGGASRAWNFGPPAADIRPVRFVLQRLRELWGAPPWEADARTSPREAAWLALDSSEAQRELGWRSVWGLDRGLRELVSWHAAHVREADMRKVSLEQIERFMEEAEAERAAPCPLDEDPI